MRAPSEGGLSGLTLDVGESEECSWLIMGSHVLQNQPGNVVACVFYIFMQGR